MDTSTWIAIYMPLFIIFIIILPQQQIAQKTILLLKKRRRGMNTMTNELIKQYVGTNCKISTGAYGTTVTGKIIEVNENWIKVETKKSEELINAEFVQNIKVVK